VSLRLLRAFSDIANASQHTDIRATLLTRAQRVAAECAGHLPKDDLVKLHQRLAALESAIASAV